MRTPTLQYLYLQKPITLIIVICIITVLPWLGMGDFSIPAETQETAIAASMLESGNWVLPSVQADKIIYQPPLAHWLVAAASLPQGYVSLFSSRLPSALAFILLMGFTLVFFGKRLRFQQAFIATLLLITSIYLHWVAMMSNIDIILVTFVVFGLFQLYRWEDQQELKGLPVEIPLLLGCAILTKGVAEGLLLPLFVFGAYLWVRRNYSYSRIGKALLYVGISSLFLPLLWYIAAWKQGGNAFLEAIIDHWGNNDGNLIVSLFIRPAWHLLNLLVGFAPWTLFFIFSLFGFKLHKPMKTMKKMLGDCRECILTMEKEKQFSLVALVCITLFYFILPEEIQAFSITPAYPFIAIFLAQYALYLTEYRTKVTRVFAGFMALTTIAGLVSIGLKMEEMPSGWGMATLLLFLVALITLFCQMSKKINLKILYATIALVFVFNLVIHTL